MSLTKNREWTRHYDKVIQTPVYLILNALVQTLRQINQVEEEAEAARHAAVKQRELARQELTRQLDELTAACQAAGIPFPTEFEESGLIVSIDEEWFESFDIYTQGVRWAKTTNRPSIFKIAEQPNAFKGSVGDFNLDIDEEPAP